MKNKTTDKKGGMDLIDELSSEDTPRFEEKQMTNIFQKKSQSNLNI